MKKIHKTERTIYEGAMLIKTFRSILRSLKNVEDIDEGIFDTQRSSTIQRIPKDQGYEIIKRWIINNTNNLKFFIMLTTYSLKRQTPRIVRGTWHQ